MSADRTHFVYQAFDADGLLLYIGCTGKPGNRYRAHMSGNGDARGWFDSFVTNWRVSGPYTKEAALALEKRLIAERHPIWNGHTPGNLYGNRGLIADYLAFHGVKFVDSPRPNRPDLVPAKRRRHLRSIA